MALGVLEVVVAEVLRDGGTVPSIRREQIVQAFGALEADAMIRFCNVAEAFVHADDGADWLFVVSLVAPEE